MLQSVDFYYFSPTGGTKKAGLLVAEALAEHVNPVDLGKPELPELPAGDPAELARLFLAGDCRPWQPKDCGSYRETVRKR